MAIPPIDFSNLFNKFDVNTNLINKGNVLTFEYIFWRNDPSPLIIVCDALVGNNIRGINLHYLSIIDIQRLLKLANVSFGAFSYSMIRNDENVKKCFRTYKWHGIKNLKRLNNKNIINAINVVNNFFDPAEEKAMQNLIKKEMEKSNNISVENILDQEVDINK